MRVHALFAGGLAEGQMTTFKSDERLNPPVDVRVATAAEPGEDGKVEAFVYFLEEAEKLLPIPGHWTALYSMPVARRSAPSLITLWL